MVVSIIISGRVVEQSAESGLGGGAGERGWTLLARHHTGLSTAAAAAPG